MHFFKSLIAAASLSALVIAAPTPTIEKRADKCGLWDTVQTGGYLVANNLWGYQSGSGSQCFGVDGLSGTTLKWHTSFVLRLLLLRMPSLLTMLPQLVMVRRLHQRKVLRQRRPHPLQRSDLQDLVHPLHLVIHPIRQQPSRRRQLRHFHLEFPVRRPPIRNHDLARQIRRGESHRPEL